MLRNKIQQGNGGDFDELSPTFHGASTNLPEAGTERSPSRALLSPADAVILVIALGLAAGYLDLVFMLLKKYYLSELRHFRSARDFPWTVPAGHVVLLSGPVVGVGCR